MGNSIHKKKKKVQGEKNLSSPLPRSPSLNREKPSGFWLLGHPEKLKTAGPKGNENQKRLTVHYTASQHYQENVFIEGSRPQYLEDLHTEAQEGLKIKQQEEHKNGVSLPDDETIDSTDTLLPEQDIGSNDRGSSPESRSTIGNTDPTVLVGDRPVLTRQGSTFKPLNPVKRLDRSRKRSRRTTIMGIPNQVQKELALHRSSTCQPLVSAQLNDHGEHGGDSKSGVVVIPTVDGGTPVANKEGARVHLSELEAFRDEQLVRKHLQLQSAYHDEQSIGSHLCPTSNLRPKSLAVPGMTTSFSISPSVLNFLQEPQGPVMSISPQATYLSTIIPNAVLPASVEVIEIDRSTSRTRGGSVNHGSTVRTVSKSSLTSGDSSVSPLSSRRSDDDGSQTKNDLSLMPSSATGSNWSGSQSSKTIVSNSSPASSKREGHNVQDGTAEQPGEEQDLHGLHGSVSGINSKRENAAGATESTAAGERAKNKRNCARNLSIMKTKQPPAPPRRTNSLHGNKIREDPRVLVDIKDVSDSASEGLKTSMENIVAEDGTELFATNTCMILTPASNPTPADSSPTPVSPSPASSNPADGATEPLPESRTSSLQKTTPEGGKFERTMSPSSGYSSQSGTPTLSPKELSPTSPDKEKKKPIKPERSASRASSSAASPSSSLTSLSSGTSELANPDASTSSPTLSLQGSSAAKELMPNSNPSSFSTEVRELLNIPPPPKIKAPCPPPPETWAHNTRTVELLCGPCPEIRKVAQKPAQILNNTDNQTETRTEKQVIAENQTNAEISVPEISENKAKPEALTAEGAEPEQEVREEAQDKEKANMEAQREESGRSVQRQETTQKKDPPPVMKKPTAVLHRRETEQPIEMQQRKISIIPPTKVHSPAEDSPPSHNALIVVVDEPQNEMERDEVPSIQTLSIDVPKIGKTSPPPTPPPAYHPTPPLLRKTPSSPASTPPNELQRVQEELHVAEPCWPPPPPPLVGESAFDGSDEVDFPPPPPLFITDSVTDETDSLKLSEGQTKQKPDLAAAFPQPAAADVKLVVDVLGSKADAADEASFQLVQKISSVPERLSPLPVETSPVTLAERPVSVSAVAPSSSFLKRNSLKIEDQCPSAPLAPTVPVAPPPPTENLSHGVNFRRQPSGAYRDARSKELLSRHKSTPIPKEDANIPLVTPSLLQMVRLRSVSMTEDQLKAPSEDKSINEGAPVQEAYPISTQGPQSVPQKPIRKSLSLKSSPQMVKTSSVTMSSPSTRLQEAIRMKTAAMSSRDGLPSRIGIRSPMYSCSGEPQSLKFLEGCDVHKSPASTASFIFSRSTKKVVIETASAPEAQAALKQSLAAELMQVSDQANATRAACSNGGMKCDKVPPPVAKKPAPGSMSPSHNSHSCSAKMELGLEGNGAHVSRVALPETTTRITADTIETLF